MATTASRTNPLSYLTDQLNDLKQKGTYFKLRVVDDEQVPVCIFDGKKAINLAFDNDRSDGNGEQLESAADRC
jgi:glycine C-acetyltransferase